MTKKAGGFNYPDDWRGKQMARVSQLIHQVDPEVTEEVKWRTKSNPDGVLVWYHD